MLRGKDTVAESGESLLRSGAELKEVWRIHKRVEPHLGLVCSTPYKYLHQWHFMLHQTSFLQQCGAAIGLACENSGSQDSADLKVFQGLHGNRRLP
ncbi:hypothetical protein INR49_024786 [Caranx melampygus]|nr:hypothetical protein INR49_024786 [Caranx melampygus]